LNEDYDGCEVAKFPFSI